MGTRPVPLAYYHSEQSLRLVADANYAANGTLRVPMGNIPHRVSRSIYAWQNVTITEPTHTIGSNTETLNSHALVPSGLLCNRKNTDIRDRWDMSCTENDIARFKR